MPTTDGLTSEPMRQALAAAIAGRPAALEALLCRHGGGADSRPNLRLATALGADLARAPGAVSRLLARLAANDAAPDTPEVFFPMAAAYGWAARIGAGLDVDEAWAALSSLAADERAPVRLATREALRALAMRPRGGTARTTGVEDLVARAAGWLDDEDRENRFGAAAVVIEVLADRRALAGIGARSAEALYDYLSRAIAEIADAPRAAERSETRRRLLLSLPAALASAPAVLRTGDRSMEWLEAECANARHPDVRSALSSAMLALRGPDQGGEMPAQRLREALEGSAKPPRDPTRLRPGTGRGKASRRVR